MIGDRNVANIIYMYMHVYIRMYIDAACPAVEIVLELRSLGHCVIGSLMGSVGGFIKAARVIAVGKNLWPGKLDAMFWWWKRL